jgi:hypothetical protein
MNPGSFIFFKDNFLNEMAVRILKKVKPKIEIRQKKFGESFQFKNHNGFWSDNDIG